MKKNLLITITLLFNLSLFAQTGFVVYQGQGKIILNSGDSIVNKLYYRLTNPRKVSVAIPGAKDKDYNYNEVKEFFIEDKHYLAVKSKGIGNPNMFALQLNPASERIKVLRYDQQPSVVVNENYAVTTEYFVQLPGEEYALGLMDMKMMPFNKKMSKVVESCSALAQKVANKDEGYKIGMISSDLSRLPVYLKIAEEFEKCTQAN